MRATKLSFNQAPVQCVLKIEFLEKQRLSARAKSVIARFSFILSGKLPLASFKILNLGFQSYKHTAKIYGGILINRFNIQAETEAPLR